eukprot:jgi/Phyca11/13788/fgenesh1_pg.PHYCAscaffold_5_\
MTAIEVEDVMQDSEGITCSKFYSAIPFMDDDVHGVNSTAAGVYFVTDFTFFQDQDLTGFVPNAKRGEIAGSITDANDVLGGSDVVVGFSNADAQYWVKVAAGSKTITSPKMPVGTASVTVTEGESSKQSVTYELIKEPIWRIGEWDGTPNGFLNADKTQKMHPADVRMAAWEPITLAAGSDGNSKFPMAPVPDNN